MTFTSGFIVPLAAAVLAISSTSTQALLPADGRGRSVPSQPREACAPERLEAPTACGPAGGPPPGPPTWWPQTCPTVAGEATQPRHAGGSSVTMSRLLAITVLALAAVVCAAGRMMSNDRRPQPDRRDE